MKPTAVLNIAVHLLARVESRSACPHDDPRTGTRAVFSGDAFAAVRRLACCTGSGASMIGDALAGGADAYVTGDLKYHDADRAGGMPLIHVPHAAVEGTVLKRWTKSLGRMLAEEGVETGFAQTDTDPWQVA